MFEMNELPPELIAKFDQETAEMNEQQWEVCGITLLGLNQYPEMFPDLEPDGVAEALRVLARCYDHQHAHNQAKAAEAAEAESSTKH